MFLTLIYPSSGAVLQASACNTDTTPTQPHRNSNTHLTKNNTAHVVIQKNSRKIPMMDILMSETCCARKKWNKIASDIKLVFIIKVWIQKTVNTSIHITKTPTYYKTHTHTLQKKLIQPQYKIYPKEMFTIQSSICLTFLFFLIYYPLPLSFFLSASIFHYLPHSI